VNFQEFRELNRKWRWRGLGLLQSRPRTGSPDDRGKVLPWPGEQNTSATLKFAPYGDHPGGFWRRTAPGIVTGAADVDPSMVITATVAGAVYGYQLLWVVLLCVPFLLNVFSVTARIGHETRRGLVDLLGRSYGRPFALVCAGIVVAINLTMVVADLLAVTDALSIILEQRRVFFVAAVAFVVWYILIFHNYQKITRALVFLAMPLFVYVATAIFSDPPLSQVVTHTFIPRILPNPEYAWAIVGLFGSLLTPYVLVWQTSSRREQSAAVDANEHRMGTFVCAGLCFAIIVAAATVLRNPQFAQIPLSTRLAARALEPAVGQLGPVLFALGIIGAGMVALPVLVASMCYSVAEAFGWEYGLSTEPWDARGFWVLISLAVFIAAAVNFLRIDPVQALFWSQVLAGILTIPILAFILSLSNDRRVMKSVNSRSQNFWIGAAAGGLTGATLLVVLLKIF